MSEVDIAEQAKFTHEQYKNPKELYSEPTLGKMVTSYLSEENYKRSANKSKDRKKNLKFYPSSIGQTDRDIVLGMLGYIGAPTRGEGILIMENGTSFHNRMEAIFEDMGIMIAPELSLKDKELHISGRSDAIVWNYLREEDEPDGEIITLRNPQNEVIYHGPENYILLVEFKSISENGYYNLRKSKPKDEHMQQLQLYFYLTGITKGIVYYENKNNQKSTEYIIERDEEIIQQVTGRIRRLLKMAEEGKVPEAEHVPTDFPARFSNYKDLTYPNPNPFRFEDLFKTEAEFEQGNEVPF